MNFKFFLESDQSYKKDTKSTLNKIPKKHSGLIKDYKIIFEPDNTLKNDEDHIGFIDEEKKTITIASPWHYGREYTLLHEIAHAVWKYLINEKMRNEWSKAVKKEKKIDKEGLDQNVEELFCMTYAQYYCKNKMLKFEHPNLIKFIDKIPK